MEEGAGAGGVTGAAGVGAGATDGLAAGTGVGVAAGFARSPFADDGVGGAQTNWISVKTTAQRIVHGDDLKKAAEGDNESVLSEGMGLLPVRRGRCSVRKPKVINRLCT